MDPINITETVIAGNELWRIGTFFGVILASLVGGKVLAMMLSGAGNRFKNRGNVTRAAMFNALSKSTIALLFTIALKIGLRFLVMPEKLVAIANSASSVAVVFAIGWLIYCLVEMVDAALQKAADRTASKMDDMLVPMVRKSLRVTIFVLVMVQVAQILSGESMASIVAGLGVGGLAIALAAQETVKNFFGSLVILADKPFELGDRIKVDGFDGSIEEVGFRSTKIRTLDGHLVTVPNGELANKSIENVSARPHIKRVMQLGLTYDTPPEKVEKARAILNELLADHEGMHADFPPRIHFTAFADSALNIQVLYWYHPPDYWAFMDFHQGLNDEILRRFNAEGLEFAFPSRTLYLAGDEKRPVNLGMNNG